MTKTNIASLTRVHQASASAPTRVSKRQKDLKEKAEQAKIEKSKAESSKVIKKAKKSLEEANPNALDKLPAESSSKSVAKPEVRFAQEASGHNEANEEVSLGAFGLASS